MITTASGLQYEDTTPGTGAVAAAGQQVAVHYTGWLHAPTAANGRGTKFDSSKDRGDRSAFTSAPARSSAAGTKACRA